MGKGGTEEKGRGWMRCRLRGRIKGGSVSVDPVGEKQ